MYIIFDIMYITLRMELSKNISNTRVSKGLTQLEVAVKLGIEQSNYSRLEARGEKLTIEQLQKIAKTLGVGVSELLGIEVGAVKNSTREADLEKRVAELEDRVKDKDLIISNLKVFILRMIRNLKDGIENGIVKCALENNIAKKESYEKYIIVEFSENGSVEKWLWQSVRSMTRLVENEDLSLFMSQEQIAEAIHKLDEYSFVGLVDAVYNEYLPKSISDAYDYYLDNFERYN